MSKKVFNVFSILCFALVLCFIGCTELINPKTETDINLNIDLSKIIKSTRNTGETQSSVSLGENPTIKVAIYDAKDYDKATNSTENLTLITQAQASVGGDGIARVKLSDIPVGIYAIVFAELSFKDENSTQVVYAGNSEVFKVKASDNKVRLILKKVANSELFPDDSNTPYENYTLYNENGEEVSDDNEATISTSSTGETKVIVTNPDNSDSVWTYFVKPENKSKFIENANYKVSVELKADKTTVVGIAAARADYFFTVNSDWTPCEFETGYVKGSTDHDFTIGLGLSSEIEIRNLKIEKLETTYTTEPSLVFDISKYAIETYLEKTDKATKIIDVTKEATNENNLGYTITINAPLSHSGATVQDVKLHLRSYATEKTGANRVSFRVDNLGANTFYTSVMADTASKKSTAWNNGTNQIDLGKFGSYVIDFPNYVANDELIVDVITSSKEAITEPIKLKISEFAVTNDFSDDVPPFANKIFAIQINEVWTKIEADAFFSKEVTINADSCSNFYVGLFNDFNYEKGTPSDFVDVTRFLYTGNTNITDNITYAEEYDDSGNPKFKISNNSGSDKIVKISLNEKYEVVIEEVPQVTYAEGLTCEVDSVGTVTLYISNADGLAKFRDIVNGTLTEDISVRHNDNSTSKHDFSANRPQLNINAELKNDIDLNNVSWTPIGKNSTDGYKGTFDGAKHEIKGLIINSSDTNNPQGLFCSVYGGTVKNLVVQGSIRSSCYTGGITGYLNGGTIENCVNNVEINNSASNGTGGTGGIGGIVGYVANSTATIKNCVNIGNVNSSQSTVGGIVGTTDVMSETKVSISKCINMGKISAPSIVAGILGLAYTITIENCINLGKVISTDEDYSYAAGIVIPSYDDVSVTVTNCINAGNVVTNTNNCSVGAISTSENGIYTNNYYDSTVNSSVDSSISGITGKSTSELIALTSENLSDQWSFVDGCYPLPDITETIPGGANGEIWSAVIEAATTEVSSSGGTTTIYSIGDVYSKDGTPIGVVFNVTENYVYIIGLEEQQLVYGTTNCVTQIESNEPTNIFNNVYDGCQNMTNWYSFITTNSNLFSSAEFPAFNYCLTYRDTEGEAGTWYLPASQELSMIKSNIETLNNTLQNQDSTEIGTSSQYWSSTYVGDRQANVVGMSSGSTSQNTISTNHYVRPCKRIKIIDGSSEVLIEGLYTANAVSVISNISAGEHYIKLASSVNADDLEYDIYEELSKLLDDEGNPTAFVYLDLSSTHIQELPPQTFYRLASLKGITLPSTIETIDASAFQGCINLTKFVVPADNQYFTVDDAILLNKAGNKLISYPSATNYTIPENITSLAEYAFGDATNLTSVTIHANLKDIPSNAFYGACYLETFTVNSSNSKYTTDETYQILLSKDKTELISWPYAYNNITIPDSVTKIADYALAETGITSVVLNNVEEIGDYAFYSCLGYQNTDFTSLTIPSSVTKIGKYAFYECNYLEEVDFADSINWTVINDEGQTESVTVTNFNVNNLIYASDDEAAKGYADYTWIKDSSSASGGGNS